MNYTDFINSCKLKNPNPYQKHHILPLSVGGTNHWTNVIKISFEDHWEAHRLLALENPDNTVIQNEFKRMGTLEQFVSKSKKQASQTGKNNSQYGKAPTKGKHWKMSDVARENVSHGKIGKSHKGKPHSEETKKRISEIQKERHKNGAYADSHTTQGRKWFTNGVDNILTFECPDGYRLGRTRWW